MKIRSVTPLVVALSAVLAFGAPAYAEYPHEPAKAEASTQVEVTAHTVGVKRVGQSTAVWGNATNVARAKAQVQVLVRKKWLRSVSGRVRANGSYALALTYGKNRPGTYTYRVVVTSRGTSHVSNVVTLTRTPRPAKKRFAGKTRSTRRPGAVYYKNCRAVRAAGKAPLRRGQPGYARHLDRDRDGIACE